ncbi:effector-associated constant component EACC1 [Micromonospora sp. CA-111912]|uniref:effector-associated constant component EACC1 n=1 Tax=Micromonospora sp. CA-111912 TaxID=3239955 RepID=UPI003D8ACBF8
MTGTPTGARQPVRMVLVPRTARPPRVPLLTWLHQRPEFRAGVRDSGGRTGGRPGFSDAVIIAVVAQALLPGLFGLLQSWVDQQRTEVSIRIQVGDSEVEVQVNGRTDATKLIDQATRALRQAAQDADRPDRALPAADGAPLTGAGADAEPPAVGRGAAGPGPGGDAGTPTA